MKSRVKPNVSGRTVTVLNRQRLRRVNPRILRQIVESALSEQLKVGTYEIALHLVGEKEMARLNWQFLGHEGSTDVITFDQTGSAGTGLQGEIFICLHDAVVQAGQFETSWQAEVVRYALHGLLHLMGHDDLQPAARRKMKREENRLVRNAAKQFPLGRLAG